MSRVRLLVGTHKGGFILTSDAKRQRWDVSGPEFAGWEIYHIKGSPVDPDRLFASQSTGWFGQQIQRSNDGGKTWASVDNKFVYEGKPGTHQWYDGTPHPWEFKRVWHLEPSLIDPDVVYAGVEDAAFFQSTDGGQTWHELAGLRQHTTGSAWAPGAGGLCLHTIVQDPRDFRRIFIAISAAGVFRTDDGGETWRPMNRGLRSQTIPDQDAEVGHCVHRIAMHPSRPRTLFMQKHWDVMRSTDAGEAWHEVSGDLPSSATSRRCYLSRFRRCHDSNRASVPLAQARAGRRRTPGAGRWASHAACDTRRARSTVSRASWNDSRPRDAAQARFCEVFCVFAGFLARGSRYSLA